MQEFLLRFLPASQRPSERGDLHRALLVIAGGFLGGVTGLLIAAMQAAWGIRESALACSVFAAVSFALPFWVRRTGRWRAAAAVMTALIWSTSFGVAALTGGTVVPALYYLVFAAAVATITLGARVGIALAVVNTLVVGGLYALHVEGVAPLRVVATELGLRSAMRGAFVFNGVLAALVAAYEWLRAAALRESAQNERRYRALADYGPDLIAEIDEAGRIAHVSGGGGALNAILNGRAALDTIHADDRAAVRDAVRLLETQASVRVGPLRWRERGSGLNWFEASLTRFHAGKRRHGLVVARDVTARMNLEAQLRQSQKMQAVGQLASGLAHDFNNLLMVVSGYAESLVGRLKSDPEASAALEEIQRATDQGAALTRRLLALSRPTVLQRTAIDLNAVVRENEKMLRVLLGESITLLLEVPPGDARVRADAGEIEQVLVNLVANARDALPSGGTVRIASFARGGRASLVVHDNGAGIAPALRERIFEPFFTTRADGTGLGLAVVRSVIAAHGGRVGVAARAQGGAEFEIRLPEAHAGVALRSGARATGGGTALTRGVA